VLDVEGAAAYLHVPVRFIRRLVLEKRVKHYKVGKYLRFRPEDLDAVLEPVEVEWAAARSAGQSVIRSNRLEQAASTRSDWAS
jgi:excisionase family DNA binding protein